MHMNGNDYAFMSYKCFFFSLEYHNYGKQSRFEVVLLLSQGSFGRALATIHSGRRILYFEYQ